MIDFAFNFRYLVDQDYLAGVHELDMLRSVITTPDLFYSVKNILANNTKMIEVPLDAQGLIDLDEFRAIAALNDAFYIISAVNFETGVIAPLDEITEIIGSDPNNKMFVEMPSVDANIGDLRNKLEDEILQKIPFSRLNGPTDRSLRSANTSSISFRNTNGETIAAELSEKGMIVKTGSACAGTDKKPSRTLQAMNVPYEYAMGSIHFSLGPEITEQDVDKLIRELTVIVDRIREYSF